MHKKNVFIIGGGVVGLAVGCALQRIPGTLVYIIEKNTRIRDDNQSSRNSGVIHAGIYYPSEKSPLKAAMCVEGNPLLYEFCRNHGVLHRNTGKLVVASEEREIEYLDETLRIANENGVPSISWIDGHDIARYEPNVTGVAALHVPTSGIVDAMGLIARLHAVFRSLGGEVIKGAELKSVIEKKDGFDLNLTFGKSEENIWADFIVNSAGLYSDEVAKMVDPDFPHEVEGVRGEAAKFYPGTAKSLMMSGMNVYPAPYGYCNLTGEKARVSFSEYRKLLAEGKITKTVGVHLTPVFDIVAGETVAWNTITVGPAKTVGRGKLDYCDGLRPLSYYENAVRGFFPTISEARLEYHQAGIMAVPKNHPDYIIEPSRNNRRFINLVGIDSPGLTSCIAIGRHVKEMMNDMLR